MEAALLHSSTDEAKNPKRHHNQQQHQSRPFIPSRRANLYHTESLPKQTGKGGVFVKPPFPLSSSLPRLNSSPYLLEYEQPPLLPLPPRQFRSLPTPSAGATHQLSPISHKNPKGRRPVRSNRLLGPNPDSLPKRLNLFCGGAVFPEAPPPSSLPRPTFSLRPKVSCKAEARGGVGAETGAATGNLCRLLNLR